MKPETFYWECNICHCSFSGHCDREELMDHVYEEHYAVLDEVHEELFTKRIASYLKRRAPND